MNILAELKARFAAALSELVEDPTPWLDQIRPSGDPSRGDYQANLAMPLSGRLKQPAREVAERIVAALAVDDLCQPPQVAGPGFINLTLRDDWLARQVGLAARDPRLGVQPVDQARRYVIDYSAPNVAKPMHVGHIRSTAIGHALAQILKFLGHETITDNHIGDWGTQFGMIIVGYRQFLDAEAYQREPVAELARLYRLVRQLADYHAAVAKLPRLEAEARDLQATLQTLESQAPTDKAEAKKHRKEVNRLSSKLRELTEEKGQIDTTRKAIERVEQSPELRKLTEAHPDIYAQAVAETARLHAGDPENLALWKEFLPVCLEELEHTYKRLGVSFDHALGESFYHDMLAGVVDDFKRKNIARESEAALCVFFAGSDVPMIIQKRDGAFLYATTDLATIQYRVQQWNPDAILYVVDFRQSDHFEKLFAATRLWGITECELTHVKFGTVNDTDGKPFKTRGGGTVGLDGLLDEAVRHAAAIVAAKDDANPEGPQLSPRERAEVAEMVGIGAILYNDLTHNRESDYVFDYNLMMQTDGNTAAYMQYAYARACGILRRGGTSIDQVMATDSPVELATPEERALGLELLRFHEALEAVTQDYRPNLLTNYLWDMTRALSRFYENCPVLKADESTRGSRLVLCVLAARTLATALRLLGIGVRDRM